MRISSNLNKIVLFILFYTAMGFFMANAKSDPEKAQIMSTAKTTCETAAKNKYGIHSIKSLNDRVKWSKGHKGALVKMKIQPKAKKSQKYHCVVDSNAGAIFFKI